MARIAFMGSPQAAVPCLEALAKSHTVELVVTQIAKPKGRGLATGSTAVAASAGQLGLETLETAKLHSDETLLTRLHDLKLDVIVVVAFGQILPTQVLNAPSFGCLNLHFSLLPRWRGASPVARAILAGDQESGITFMKMDEGLDTGPIISQRSIPLRGTEITGALTDQMSHLGASQVAQVVDDIVSGVAQESPQPDEGVTHADKIHPAQARLDFTRDANYLARLVRACNPRPGAWTMLENQRIQVLEARVADSKGKPGSIVSVSQEGIEVGSATHALLIQRLKPAGRNVMSATDFWRGRRGSSEASFD